MTNSLFNEDIFIYDVLFVVKNSRVNSEYEVSRIILVFPVLKHFIFCTKIDFNTK